jgi:hydrogenase maturation protease
MSSAEARRCLVLGIGNVLMGDEGIGVHVVRRIPHAALPPGVDCLDGGTGGLHLLGPMQSAGRVVLIDATVDGNPPGTVRRLRPRFSSDYPPSLTAHDIGLKDLLDALELLGGAPEVTLFAVSIDPVSETNASLSPSLEARVSELVETILAEVRSGSADAREELSGGNVDDPETADPRLPGDATRR